MYRTLTRSSGIPAHLLAAFGVFDPLEQEADARGQLGGGPLEGGQLLVVGARLAGRIRKAPVDQLGRPGELGAHLADPVAEADHVVETLAGELAHGLGT